ncbi:nucleolar MIF4G domain-containing protein 1 isoform X2 [Panicum miliaceum]|uniref:Nucleolar MIF4G domain-containing protein 1 isoform X2 n=1 Tax=Panicum miliaceum TaxID=4540 RepID=A0A3L6RF07_PANMI|nr:nucleolar MIF4G domain-containing protein 1 isoform X2 [Panicum miliaceum]
MTGKSEQKSRKERRKEARSEKQKLRFLSWVQHQGGKKKKLAMPAVEPSPEEGKKPKKEPATVKKKRKRELEGKHKPKSNFQEYLEMEMGGAVSMEEDLEMERRLAKKLKVKKGKLGGPDDGMDELFADLGFGGDFGSDDETKAYDRTKGKKKKKNVTEDDMEMEELGVGDEENDRKKKKKKKVKKDDMETEELDNRGEENNGTKKKRKKKKPKKDDMEVEELDDGGADMDEENDGAVLESEDGEANVAELSTESKGKYVPPSLRASSNSESEEIAHMRRRVRGLLNRLSESNVESITQEIATLFRSVPRSVGCQVIGDEVLASCSRGPRGNDQYAAVFAAFVAGMACLVGIDFSAKILASIAKTFEDEYSKEDSISLRNLTLLFCFLCIFGVISSDLVYDLLSILSKRLTEMDVSTVLTILQCCGMKLRGDDPGAMKDFVLSIQNSVNQLKLHSGVGEDGKTDVLYSTRMKFMLDTICDIKNNKKRPKDVSDHTRIKKWLQKLKAEDVLLRGLTWSRLLDPDKKGQWWLSGDVPSAAGNIEDVAAVISKDVAETQKLLQLAAAQRMNTDIRRAIFCIIMSAEDYVDAFEKLLRLGLSGKQDREIIRVIVDCCLQEKMFNKYYAVLASKLCSHEKNHKFSLQYCIWDHFKELDNMEPNRSMNLAKLVAEMLSNFTLSLATLKVVNLANPVEMTPGRIAHFQVLFETLLQKDDALVWNVFTRIAGLPELEILRDGIVLFIKQHVIAEDTGKDLASKFKIAKKALDNTAGVLM